MISNFVTHLIESALSDNYVSPLKHHLEHNACVKDNMTHNGLCHATASAEEAGVLFFRYGKQYYCCLVTEGMAGIMLGVLACGAYEVPITKVIQLLNTLDDKVSMIQPVSEIPSTSWAYCITS